MATVDPELLRQGMRQLVGPVSLITAAHAGQRRGLTATAICSPSAEPPSLLVCVNRQAEAHDLIVMAGRFCVNVLACGQQRLAEIFAARDGSKGEVRFAHGQWSALATGALCHEGCLLARDCRLVAQHPAATSRPGPIAHNTELLRGEHTMPLLHGRSGKRE